VAADDGALDVAAVRDQAASDPLRHYRAVVRTSGWVLVGNGDHVEPVAQSLAKGADPLAALSPLIFEPDAPIFTSRICLAVRSLEPIRPPFFGYVRHRHDGGVDRVVWQVSELAPGEGVLMTTYDGSAEHVRSTIAPVEVSIASLEPSNLIDEVWDGLDPALRVGIAVTLPNARDRPLLRS
jgi:IMP cyclohydrolase